MSVGVALVWSTRIYIFININRRGGAKSKLRDLFLSSKFHNERVLYFWIFSAIFAYHLHPLYFCALEFSINAWTSEWWIIEPVLIKDKPHRIHRMRFAFALFINKWTDLAKFSSFFLWNLVRFNNSIRYSTTQDDHVRSDKSLNYHFFAKPSSLRPSKFPNRRPCNEATPSALFSSSSFQTIVTQRSVNKRELISCCPTRFVSLWQSWQVLQPKDKPNTFRSSSTRQRKRKFARLGQPYRLVESLAFSLTKISISNTDDTRERIEIEFVNENPPPQRIYVLSFPTLFNLGPRCGGISFFPPSRKS